MSLNCLSFEIHKAGIIDNNTVHEEAVFVPKKAKTYINKVNSISKQVIISK